MDAELLLDLLLAVAEVLPGELLAEAFVVVFTVLLVVHCRPFTKGLNFLAAMVKTSLTSSPGSKSSSGASSSSAPSSPCSDPSSAGSWSASSCRGSSSSSAAKVLRGALVGAVLWKFPRF
jgi:hypothetical protein